MLASIKPEKYSRKAFEVEAVEVTPQNIHEVAQWCGGEVKQSDTSKDGGREGFQEYIKVQVKRPLSDRQTRAYYGDWVLLAKAGAGDAGPAGFKVYTPKAFTSSFEKKVDHMIDTVRRMNERAAQEEKIESQDEVLDFADFSGVRQTAFSDPI